MTRCTIDKVLNELYVYVVAKCCLIICMHVFFVVLCNSPHAALSSIFLFLCASVCGTARAFYMNFTIGSIDDSLFGISCDRCIFSEKSA